MPSLPKLPRDLKELREGLTTLRAWSGTLTEELVREPGKFGLGQVPSRLVPDATTTPEN